MVTKEGQSIPVSGPMIVRSGVGDADPNFESWSLRYSTAVGVLKLETQTSPAASIATPYGP